MARPLPTGVSRTATGYRVRVHVRPYKPRTKRFPRTTPIGELTAWRDAQREDLRRRKRLQRPGSAAPRGTIGADVETYLRQWTARHPQTVAQRTRHLHLWAQAFAGRARWTLTPTEIAAQLATWRVQGLPPLADAPPPKHKPRAIRLPLDGATLRKVRQALFQLYRVLDRGSGSYNPVADVPPAPVADPQPRGVPLAILDEVFRQMRPSTTRSRLRLVAYAGLMPIEVLRLQREDIDLTHGTLLVPQAKTRERTRIALLPEAREAVEDLVARGALSADGQVAQSNTAPWNVTLRRACAKAAAALELDSPIRLTVYDLRHSFGTAILAATGNQRAAQAALRHRQIATTHRYTLAAVPPQLQAALDALAHSRRVDSSVDTGCSPRGSETGHDRPDAERRANRIRPIIAG